MRDICFFEKGTLRAEFVKNGDEGTLTFSGEGEVSDTNNWVYLEHDEKKIVRTFIFKDGITGIDECEFNGRYHDYINLEKIIFQGDVDEIKDCAFSDCCNLKTIEFHGKCKRLSYMALPFGVIENIDIPEGCSLDRDALAGTSVYDIYKPRKDNLYR